MVGQSYGFISVGGGEPHRFVLRPSTGRSIGQSPSPRGGEERGVRCTVYGVWCIVYSVRCVLVNQKRGGATWRSNVYRLLVPHEQAPRAQYPLTLTSNSRVARPPYKNTLLNRKGTIISLPKMTKIHAGCGVVARMRQKCTEVYMPA